LTSLKRYFLASEESKDLTGENINEIFRIMHTIKSSSAMMEFNNISKLSHKVEDLFYLIRENRPDNLDCSQICDLVLLAFDFIKGELSKIEEGKDSDGDESSIVKKISSYVEKLSENGEINKDNVDLNLKNPGPVNMQPEEQKAADPETAKQTGLSVFEAKVYFEKDAEWRTSGLSP
jgi:two-component system chemotaxis sensor kinase CheA